MKKLQWVFIAAIFFSCKQAYVPEQKDTRDFFTQTAGDLVTRRFLMVDSIEPGKQLAELFKRSAIRRDTLLNSQDIDFITEEMRHTKLGKWTNVVFKHAKLVSMSFIDSVARPDPFTHTPTYYRFSYPWFSKNKKFCVLYIDYYCGNLCAETALQLYEKVNGKWVHVLNYYRVVS